MNKKIILYIVIGIVIVALLLFTFFPNMIHAWRDAGFAGSDDTDKCTPPPGQTEESWREHMGHHPDIYRECLE